MMSRPVKYYYLPLELVKHDSPLRLSRYSTLVTQEKDVLLLLLLGNLCLTFYFGCKHLSPTVKEELSNSRAKGHREYILSLLKQKDAMFDFKMQISELF